MDFITGCSNCQNSVRVDEIFKGEIIICPECQIEYDTDDKFFDLIDRLQEEKPMQKYKCHKIVEAFKILRIEVVRESGMIEITGIGPDTQVYVPPEWRARHKPKEGGYFVRYNDSYDSYSPAKAFEDGYNTYSEDDEDKAKGEAAMAALASGLLALLDRIEIEDNPGLASQRHKMAEAVGLTVVIDHETSAAQH